MVVAAVRPSVDGGCHPVKRTLGESLRVEVDLGIDGHDLLDARLHVRRRGDEQWTEIPMLPAGIERPDTWTADVTLDRLGAWEYRVEAWVDAVATWRRGLEKKQAAGQDVKVDLLDGARLPPDAWRALATWSDPYPLVVESPRAGCSAWYELFPRSFGTLRDVIGLVPYVAEMGFDVLYLPPIHPIGKTNRKGPNNSLTAGPEDPGSPWAIGGAAGGHDAIHPELGTLEDLAALVAAAERAGIAIAIDIAFQASPDHPWIGEHPDWFVQRADGTLQYAENPPKKYQDVHPFDFQTRDWKNLWKALRDVFLVWCERGVRVFRVDNPHTKPVPFWQWCLAEVRDRYPDAIFLSEAFTRPLMLHQLAKVGFSQSYTYFTWRTGSHELRAYLEELTGPSREYLRPNFWPNTPDILPEHLQFGGRPVFAQRAILAATLTANWGIYGPAFELCDAAALPGKEEYADSEKYQRRRWDLEAPHSLRHLIARLNKIRLDHPALRQDRTLRFHSTDNEALLCYSKRAGDDVVLCVVNLDPHHVHAGWIELDLAALGIPADASYQVHDLLGGSRHLWHGRRNYVELDPQAAPGHVLSIHRQSRREEGFEYFL